MNVGDICSREVFCVGQDEPLAEAARLMRAKNVGALVVTEGEPGRLKPLGILTDRDIVCAQLKLRKDLYCLSTGDVMTVQPLTLLESSGLAEGIGALRANGVRRAPVVNEAGELIGMISLDDLLPAVAEELQTLAKIVGAQAAVKGPRQCTAA